MGRTDFSEVGCTDFSEVGRTDLGKVDGFSALKGRVGGSVR